MMANKPEVSVIIPAYNEATYIDRLLEALSDQNFGNFEVIVSDAQSKDGTAEIVDSFKKKLNIKFLEAPPKGPAYGRNQGAKAAKGEWLLFLDADDDIEDADFITKLVTTAKDNNWGSASAKMVPKDAKIHEKLGMAANYNYLKLLAHTKHPVAPGWCILTKRSIFEDAGGYNEKVHFGEDYDYVSRVGGYGFGFAKNTYYLVDLRRARSEGISLTIKAIKNEIYRHTHHYNLENNPNEYKFGHHQKRDK